MKAEVRGRVSDLVHESIAPHPRAHARTPRLRYDRPTTWNAPLSSSPVHENAGVPKDAPIGLDRPCSPSLCASPSYYEKQGRRPCSSC